MKKTLQKLGALLSLTLLMFLTVSCNKEAEPKHPLVGTWQYFSKTAGTDGDNIIELTFSFSNNGTGRSAIYEMYNGKVVTQESDTFLYWTNGNKLKIQKTTDEPYNLEYTISGKELTVTEFTPDGAETLVFTRIN